MATLQSIDEVREDGNILFQPAFLLRAERMPWPEGRMETDRTKTCHSEAELRCASSFRKACRETEEAAPQVWRVARLVALKSGGAGPSGKTLGNQLSAISCQQSAVSNQPQLVFVNLPLLRIFDGPGKARFEPFGAVGRGEDGGAAFEDTANTTTPRPAARQVSGPGFSRAVKAQKKLFLAAAGPRAAQRSALEERRG
jgi:hypothetical protein